VAAANLPDLDLLYYGITPPPLGYLLHHRGHTHTLLGLLPQALLLGLGCGLLPPFRRAAAAIRGRLWALIAAGLASHLLLDASNTYGIHPFDPFDGRWYYGDALFILKPWLWLLLGIPLAWDAAGRVIRVVFLALATLLVAVMAVAGVVGPGPLLALGMSAILVAAVTRRSQPPTRPGLALGGAVSFVLLLLGLSRVARDQARSALEPARRGAVLDVILNPNPANPLCWSVIGVEKDEAAGEYTLRRAALSLLPAWQPPSRCVSYRLAGGGQQAIASGGSVAWIDAQRQPLAVLRDRAGRDCRVTAWMRFGRAPLLRDGGIADVRFETGARGNFTAMALNPEPRASPCPAYVPGLEMPRADLLAP
jgi:inner membrane protein